MKPQRIQLRRTRGWRIPRNTVIVARPSRWGNPLKVGRFVGYTQMDAVDDFIRWLNREGSVRSFENCYGPPPTYQAIRKELRGKNLACWCKPGTPCHADILLQVANSRSIPWCEIS